MDKVFWLNNICEISITEIDHGIDQISNKIIKKYEDDGHLVNTDSDDRDCFKKYARKHQYSANRARMVNCPACDDADSRGYHWRRASNIQVGRGMSG